MNTENWDCLTTTGPSEEEYHHYDKLIAAALENIYGMSSDGVIRLYCFDRNDKEHMCILRIALIARDIFQYPIEIDASWWDVFCLNWKLRKNFNKIKRFKAKLGKDALKGINVPMLIDKFHTMSRDNFGGADFKVVYEAYYEGSCD
jgi:hypothetical protein